MVRIKFKQISEEEPLGVLICHDKSTGERIKIMLPTLAEDGVLLYHDGRIEIGGPRPSRGYFTDNPPMTDEVVVNVDGWLNMFYEVVVEVRKEFTYLALIPK